MRLLLISVKSAVSYGGIATWTERFLANCEGHGIICNRGEEYLNVKRINHSWK